ncbi:menin isoform X2 [Epargyreus clarus]|uniref:menin isoform X2 n=1 Tax=Epargyreus clarus TaxID=520877 RepID=UPI003C2E949F
MSGLAELKHYFPIDSIQKVCDLFEEQLRSENEPDLALFSIIIGAVENNLTNVKSSEKDVNLATNKFVKMKFPSIEWEEVTWHGKGNEDKRGRAVGDGVLAHSWLYVAGKPVVCTRVMELAALVSSINPALTPTIDVHEVAQMQHKLLWLLYDNGHLDAYPMALGNLGDLDEYMKISNCTDDIDKNPFKDDIANTPNSTQRPDAAALYAQAIRSSRTYYEDRHVYPYTFQGGYYHRHKMYKEAFHAWACAGDVIRHYNYSRDDEEIYKEFSEIANELIPQLMKAESSGHSARSILKDPECFASLLRFYDGICKWEEGSQTPILHIGWAKPLVSTISKFDAEVRAQVFIICSPDGVKDEDSKLIEPAVSCDKNGSNNDKWNNNSENTEMSVREQLTAAVNSRPRVTLYSHKMAALKPLLLAERLNTHALQLQLTAQSQLQRPQAQKKNRDEDEHTPSGPTARAKRARRER